MAVNIHLSIYSYGGSLLLFAFIVTTISAFVPPASSVSSTVATRTILSASPGRLFDYNKKPPYHINLEN
jgi:hypothetical protein